MAIAFAEPALARKSVRVASAASVSRVLDIPIPKFSSSSAPTLSRDSAELPQAPARFFTINAALAKRENGSPDDTSVRFASAAVPDYLTLNNDPKPTPERGEEPFGMHAFRAPEGALWSKWRTLNKDMKDEEAALQACSEQSDDCTEAASKFQALASAAAKADGRQRLERVNQLVNAAVAYTSDYALHGQADKWSAPLATLKLGRGDCEDYAILKYRVLSAAGVPASDMRIVLVRDTAVRIDHAVLAARSGDRWFILDNRKAGFYAETDLPHYMPLFALDHSGVKLFAAPYAALQDNVPVADEVLPGMDDRPLVAPMLSDSQPLLW